MAMTELDNIISLFLSGDKDNRCLAANLLTGHIENMTIVEIEPTLGTFWQRVCMHIFTQYKSTCASCLHSRTGQTVTNLENMRVSFRGKGAVKSFQEERYGTCVKQAWKVEFVLYYHHHLYVVIKAYVYYRRKAYHLCFNDPKPDDDKGWIEMNIIEEHEDKTVTYKDNYSLLNAHKLWS